MVMGLVRKIIPFSAVDGPGNRSAIFLQGCNYDCSFCHNPETIAFHDAEAKEMSAPDVFQELGNALHFIRGITLSGGECSLQRNFLLEIFCLAKSKNLTTFIDTNGSYDFSKDPELLELTDGVMLDVKSMDPEEHIKITGKNNHMVIKNLRFLGEMRKLYEIRTVISSELLHCEKTVTLAAKAIADYKDVQYKLIRYRPNGVRSQYKQMKIPDAELMARLEKLALSNGAETVVIAG